MEDLTRPDLGAGRARRRTRHLRVGELARRVGLAASTVRSWEDRYGFPRPVRTQGGHRLYTEDDVAQLLAVRDLVAEGRSVASAIGQVAGRGLDGAPGPSHDAAALHPALMASRAIGRAATVDDVVDALVGFVEAVGGRALPAVDAPAPDAVPLNLAFGERPPLLAVAEPVGVARLRLESMLPGLVDDARVAVARLRELERLRGRERARRTGSRRATPG